MAETPGLDVLIYAHDGRGLGHASRSISIGMALRRLYPDLRVLFVSGCRVSQQLIGNAPLDWLKLPSYETQVVNGKSKGIMGKSMFSDSQLGELRGEELAHLVKLYKPRLVLADHTPQGKHRELVPALSRTRDQETLWVLGVRGVVGAVSQGGSELARQLFLKHYSALFWYGDSSVLGGAHCRQLEDQYGREVLECGYVLRLREFCYWKKEAAGGDEQFAGTISIPWLGENTASFLQVLGAALERIPASFGNWRLFVDSGTAAKDLANGDTLFTHIPHCKVEPPSSNYVDALMKSKVALIYGGYNRLMDVVYAKIPALVVLRDMQDAEQQIHLEHLKNGYERAITTVAEDNVSSEQLEHILLTKLQQEPPASYALISDGAKVAATKIHELLRCAKR